MNLENKTIDSVFSFDSRCFVDSRGTFLKVFDSALPEMREFRPQQVNHVRTAEKYTLRGLHYQVGDYAEAKLFRILRGSVQLVWVDHRMVNQNSPPSCGTIVLDKAESGVLVPRGFATGYLTLEPNSEVLYLSDNTYVPESERGLRWDDPQLALNWLNQHPTISDKDAAWPLL